MYFPCFRLGLSQRWIWLSPLTSWLQAGRSRVRFWMMSPYFSIDLTFQLHYAPGIDSALFLLSSWLRHSNNADGRSQFVKLLVMQLSPTSLYRPSWIRIFSSALCSQNTLSFCSSLDVRYQVSPTASSQNLIYRVRNVEVLSYSVCLCVEAGRSMETACLQRVLGWFNAEFWLLMQRLWETGQTRSHCFL
jgi:hypothetical protein